MAGEHPPSTPSREVLMQRTIAECYAKAEAFLNEKRIKLDDSFIGSKKLPHTSSASIFQKDEVLNDRAEVERLDALFAHNKERMSPEAKSTYESNKQFSDIFEAMFADIAPQIFGEGVEVIVPSKFDDYKRQTDLIVVFKDAEGKPEASLVVDFTTQQDVDGFDTPDGRRGGLEQKWRRSLGEIASKNQELHSVKYARVHGVNTSLNYNPRILVGLSIPEISRLASLWKAGTLDIQKEPRVRELARSVRRQLITQLHLASRNDRVQAKNRITRVLGVADRRVKRIPEDTARAEDTDSVITSINALLTPEHRQAQYEKAAQEKREFESKLTPNPKAEWKKALTEPLSDGDGGERTRLEVHLKTTDPSGNILKEVNAFLQGSAHHFTKEMLPYVAGGVPTRLWRRLNEVAQTKKTKEPEPKPKPGNAENLHNEAQTHRLDATAHLALLKKAAGITEVKYAQLDTRGKRIWSFIKEKGIRALVAGVGAAIGSTFALAMCAGALPSMLVAFGGAVAGSLLGSYLLKKYYYDKHPDKDHTKDRARAAVIQSLARWAHNNPYSFAQYYSGPHGEAALKKVIERKVFLRNFAGNALAAGVGTVAGLEVRTGGQFTKTLLSGDFDALWKLFYCPPAQGALRSAARAGIPVDGYGVQQGRGTMGVSGGRFNGTGFDGMQRTPQSSLGRGMYSSGAMYSFETPRGRLPAWMHQQCIGRCNTTAPFGYHSWVPGRIGSSGQQLYQLRYTPR